jgi:hypothetical protein
MDSHRFDAFARRFAAGTRRQALASLVSASAFSRMGPLNRAEAACQGYSGKCKKSRSCCGGEGLHCKKGRCRCQQGWQQCLPETGSCQNLLADVNHCGACGNQCPPETPCCSNGACQPLCGATCCVDCFIELLGGGIPNPAKQVCCSGPVGTICSPDPVKRKRKKNKKKKPQPTDPAADLCCYPEQICVNGECCCDGCEGAVVCGGTCCASAACCNGECCPAGQVCATTTSGQTCIPAGRPCAEGCLPSEVCTGGVCCSGLRDCGDVCCGAGDYCEFQGDEEIQNCCPINRICGSTYRGRRVRR